MEHFPKSFLSHLEKYRMTEDRWTTVYKFHYDIDTVYMKFNNINRSSLLLILREYPFTWDFFFQHYDAHKHSITYLYDYILINVLKYIYIKNKLISFKTLFINYYQLKCLKIAKIIARNGYSKDISIEFKYNPKYNTYLNSVFSNSDIYKKDFENDYYILPVSQNALKIYAHYRNTFDKEYLFKSLNTHFEYIYTELYRISDMFIDITVKNLCSEFLTNYMDQTIYNNGYTSISRLDLFIKKNRTIAQYIWDTNFSTQKERTTLGLNLNISLKHINGFIKANTLNELETYIHLKQKLFKR
jgi:hypothetical protein